MKKHILHYTKITVMCIICALPFISKAQLKISGQVFGDYAYKLNQDSLKRGSTQYAGSSFLKNYQGFDIRRAYIGVDYDLSSKVHAEVVLANEDDVLPAGATSTTTSTTTISGTTATTKSTTTTSLLSTGKRVMYVKLANVRIKSIFTGTDLLIGQIRTPSFATPGGSEETWGYRSSEKTILDMRGIAGSFDLGAGLQGKYLDGNLGYDLVYANNNGAKLEISPSTSADNAHRLYADVYGRFLNKQILVQVYGDFSSSDSTKNANVKGSYKTTNMTMKAFVAYTGKMATVGVEGFSTTKDNAVVDSKGNMRASNPFGYSIFARAGLIKDKDTSKANRGDVLSIFARYDSYDPDTKLTSDLVNNSKAPYSAAKESFLNIGLDWCVAKNTHIMPNIWLNSYTNKTSTASSTDRSDKDMVGRITFFWKF